MGNTNQGRRVGVDDPTAGHGVGVATSASQFDFEPRARADSVGHGGGPGSQPVSLSLHARSHADEAEILNQMVQASAGDEPTLNLHVSGRAVPSGAPPPSPGAHDSSTNKLPTVIRWDGGGKEVFVTGSFSAWKTRIPLVKSQESFYTIVELPEGEHQYKFLVDGSWKHSAHVPTVDNKMGSLNNLVVVHASDFEVFRALAADMGAGGPTTGPTPPLTSNLAPPSETKHTSPLATAPGVWSQELPSRRALENEPGPPWLPPHLLQVILNRDTAAHYDPSLLPEPNHVMLNHLYALSIRDGVMVLSATHRYRKKYVTTLLYKPIN